MTARFHIYQDSVGEWRWSLLDAQGEIVAISFGSHKARAACERALERARAAVVNAPVLDLMDQLK